MCGDTLSPFSCNVEPMATGSEKHILFGSCCLNAYIDSCLVFFCKNSHAPSITTRRNRSADEAHLEQITPTGGGDAEDYSWTAEGFLLVTVIKEMPCNWITHLKPGFEMGTQNESCLKTYTDTFIHTYIHTCTHLYIRTCIHTYIRTYIHTCICVYIYIYTCIHMSDRQKGLHMKCLCRRTYWK